MNSSSKLFILEDKTKALNLRLPKLLPALNEKQSRMLAAVEAKSFGRGWRRKVGNENLMRNFDKIIEPVTHGTVNSPPFYDQTN